jgi:hypothetical protein
VRRTWRLTAAIPLCDASPDPSTGELEDNVHTLVVWCCIAHATSVIVTAAT